MATITMKRPSDGHTMIVDENSPLVAHYKSQGWVVATPPAPTPTTTSTSSANTPGIRNGDWIVNQETGMGTNVTTGQQMAIQQPNPTVNPDGTVKQADTSNLNLSPQQQQLYETTGRIPSYDVAFDADGNTMMYSPSMGLPSGYYHTQGQAIQARDAAASSGDTGGTGGDTGGTGGDTGGTGSSDTAGTGDEGLTPEEKAAMGQLYEDIQGMTHVDGTPLTMAEKAILYEIAAGDYTSGQHIPSVEELEGIISDAATNAATDLSPYFETLTGRQLEDLKNKMGDIRAESERYLKQEAFNYKQKLANTKQSLRTRGLTFSGQSRYQLGQEAFASAKTSEEQGVEGILPTDRRLGWESATAGWERQARDMGIGYERALGSEGMPDFTGLADPYGGTKQYQAQRTSPLYMPAHEAESRYIPTGDIELQKKKAIEQSKWQRVSQYRPYI